MIFVSQKKLCQFSFQKMKFLTIVCVFLFISLEWMAYGQFYGCATDADCRAFGNPSCDTFLGFCNQPWDNSDCDYIGGAGTGHMVTISGTSLCSRTCSSHSDCASLPTAKICRTATPKYCVECLNTPDCTAMGFKNHNCNSGFCAAPNPTGTDCAAQSTGSNYCASFSVGCFSDTIRCWYPCTTNDDCTDSTCVPGVTTSGGGVCSSRTNLPPSVSTGSCATNNDCSTPAAPKCGGGSCVACIDDPDCTHLTPTPFCEGGQCRTCKTSDHAGCPSEETPRCVAGTPYSCTTCSIDADCTRFTSTPYCGGGGKCVICSTSDNGGCTSITASKCSFDMNYQCIACSINDDCAHLPSTPYCEGSVCRPCKTSDNSGCTTTALAKCTDTPSYQCTACSIDADCTRFTSTPYCEGGECRPCKTTDNSGCTTVVAAKCSSTPSYQCIACSLDVDCTHLSSTPYCEGGICVFCKVSDDTGCGGGTPFCDAGTTCQVCRTSDHLGCTAITTPKCISGTPYSCITCDDDAQCTRFTSTPYCEGGECRPCKTIPNTGCTDITAAKCVSSSAYSCAACTIDDDCAHLPSTPYCEGSVCRSCKTSDNSGCTTIVLAKCTDTPALLMQIALIFLLLLIVKEELVFFAK